MYKSEINKSRHDGVEMMARSGKFPLHCTSNLCFSFMISVYVAEINVNFYIFICKHTYTHIHIYLHRAGGDREGERERVINIKIFMY